MLKHVARQEVGRTGIKSGVSVMAGGIQLLVPKSHQEQAQSCTLSPDFSVSITAYPRLAQSLLNQLGSEAVVLLADWKELQGLLVKLGAPVESFLKGLGKLIVIADENELAKRPLPAHRGLDVVEAAASNDLLSFKVNRALAQIAYDRQVEIMRLDGVKRGADLETLNEIGLALSTEKDLGRLLDLIVSKSRQMTWSDAGSLYLIEADPNIQEESSNYFKNKRLRFEVAQNDSRKVPFKSFVVPINKSSIVGYVALTQDPLNFADAYHIPKDKEYGFGGREFDANIRYRTMSMLTVPMINWRGETIGVIQLINRKVRPDLILDDPDTCAEFIQPFTPDDSRIAMSIASQASIAIQNTQLVSSIRTLFDGFIDASVKAIESRDPTTSGHSQRVATLTVSLAEHVDRVSDGPFKALRFSREQLQEIRYASLLHDFGKIGVREHVLVKAKKLYPHEYRSLQDRFELVRTLTALKHSLNKAKLLEQHDSNNAKAALERQNAEMERELKELEELMSFVTRCNEPTVLAQGGFEQLNEIAQRMFVRLDGVQENFLNERELVSLSVPRGSLTEQDRKEIESHVTHTYKFLTTIPWTSDLRNVPEIAYAHHEKLDGTGYPNRLDAQRIPIQSKMMTISDIFDALTAADRPYKKALPAERALNILQEEAKAQHVDVELLEIFIGSGLYKTVLTEGAP